MVAAGAVAAFFPVPPANSSSSVNPSKGSASFSGSPDGLDVKGLGVKSVSRSAGMQVKAIVQVAPKVNETKVLKSDSARAEDYVVPSYVPRTFYNQLPDWSVLLAAITTIFLAAEKQLTLIDWKPKRPDMLADAFGLGKIIENGMVFRQNFSIRSYEIGADRTASIETLMNHLQETALNHVKTAGLLGDGFGSTPEMSKRSLIWVVTKMQVMVDYYPSWGDVVEVDTWVSSSGKNGMRRDWHIRDSMTGKTITRATSIWVMMNKNTRKLSKIPDEVRAEIEPYFIDRFAIVDDDGRKLAKLDDESADFIRKGLTPRWGDLDVNQHVNNVKYIGWILESLPVSLLENRELASMTLEYRRECGRDSVLQSLVSVSGEPSAADAGIECQHLLKLETGAEIVRGRTEWRLKPAHNSMYLGQAPAASI